MLGCVDRSSAEGDMTYRSSDTGIGLVLAVDPELLERGVAKGRRGQRRGGESNGEGLHLGRSSRFLLSFLLFFFDPSSLRSRGRALHKMQIESAVARYS